MAIVGATALALRSRTIGYNLRLQSRALVRDIHTMAEGLYNRENKSWPEGSIKVKVEDSTNYKTTITLKDALSLPGVGGQTAARGTEETPVTYDVELYQANWRKVIPKPGYGLRKLMADKYKLYDQHEADLAPWRKEDEGYMTREAFLERYPYNLIDPTSDTAALCTQWWNPNIFIPTLGPYGQPAFSRNRAVHTNNICNALVATGGFGQSVARMMTAPVIEDAINWLLASRVKQLKIPGLPTGMGWVASVSEIQMGMMTNPTYAANNLGSLWAMGAAIADPLLKWPGVVGNYGPLLFVCDERQPTLLPSGSAAPYGLQAGYMVWNSRDLRHRPDPNIKDTVFFFGDGAYADVEGEKMHWIDDTQDYNFRQGVGIAGVQGKQLPIYLHPTSQAVVYQGGAVGIIDFPNQGGQA